MNILADGQSGWASIDSTFQAGATAVAKNTDRITRFVSCLGDEMVFADQREMTQLAIKVAEAKNLTMTHVGHSITIVHKGQKVQISWTRANVKHSLDFSTNVLLIQLDPAVAMKYMSR